MNDHPTIYVACLASYNNGILHGAHIDATDDVDDVWDRVRAMLASSPIAGAEEYAIHDYDNFHGLRIAEYTGIERVCAFARLISEHGEPAAAWLEYSSEHGDDVDTLEERFADAYEGEYNDAASFAMDWPEQVYGDDAVFTVNGWVDQVPEALAGYLDYDAIGSDLLSNGGFYSVKSSNYTLYVFTD